MKINFDADLMKVLRRIPIKIVVMKTRSLGCSSMMIQPPVVIPSAMQGMKL